jgi:hypothetical protein
MEISMERSATRCLRLIGKQSWRHMLKGYDMFKDNKNEEVDNYD